MKIDVAAQLKDLYPDRHLNVFVPYNNYDLDYNVTRALISTLRWSDPSLVRHFLKDIAGVDLEEGAHLLYDLQACDYDDYDPEQCETRKMIGISRGGEVATRLPAVDHIYQPHVLSALRRAADKDQQLAALQSLTGKPELTIDDLEVLEHTLEEYERGSLPDGWIFSSDRKACVLIEAKLTRYLDQHQLDRHTETWFGEPCRGDDLVLVTWERIAEFAKQHSQSEHGQTAFLCRQLFEYLEILGQAPFESFKPFDLDGDSLLDSLPKLSRFAELVAESARDQGIPLSYKIINRGSSVRIPFGDPSLLGAVGFELQDDALSFIFTLGEDLPDAPKAGSEAADQALAGNHGGLVNPLQEWQPEGSGYKVGIDRWVFKNNQWNFDLRVYEADFDAAAFSEVLDELVTQHPKSALRQAQGRSGVLIVSQTLRSEAVLIPSDELKAQALTAFKDYAAMARRLPGLATAETPQAEGEAEAEAG